MNLFLEVDRVLSVKHSSSFGATRLLFLGPPVAKQMMKVDGVRPTEKFYMALLRATGEGGRTDKTLDVLDEMKEIGLKPGVRSYNCAVGACGKVSSSSMHLYGCHAPTASNDFCEPTTRA